MKRLLTTLTLAATLALSITPAHAQSNASHASAGVSLLSGIVVIGSIAALGEGAGQTVVGSLRSAGESATMELRNVSTGATISIKVSAAPVREAGLAVGSAVQVTAEASGYALTASGKLIAFITNEIGASLLGSSLTSSR